MSSEQTERNFKGVWIPKEIYLREDIDAFEKILLAEIDSLSRAKRGCIAGDDYLCAFMQCNRAKLQRSLHHLKELALIETISFNGRVRELSVNLKNIAVHSEVNEDIWLHKNETADVADLQHQPRNGIAGVTKLGHQVLQNYNSSSDKNDTYISTPINPIINTPINKEGDYVHVRDLMFSVQEWRISAMLKKWWDDIDWNGIHDDAVPYILDFFRWRRDVKKKPVISGEMANEILNPVRGMAAIEIKKLVYRAQTSGGGWLKLVYDNGKLPDTKKQRSADVIRNMR